MMKLQSSPLFFVERRIVSRNPKFLLIETPDQRQKELRGNICSYFFLFRFVVRKSTDLKKIRGIDDKIEAILASPMIEVRRKTPGRSNSLAPDSMLRRFSQTIINNSGS